MIDTPKFDVVQVTRYVAERLRELGAAVPWKYEPHATVAVRRMMAMSEREALEAGCGSRPGQQFKPSAEAAGK